MTGVQRSRPDGNRTAKSISAEDASIVTPTPGFHAAPAECDCSDWGNGFDAGYLAGIKSAALSEEARAEAAAHRFYQMEAHQEWLSKFVPATISAMEVEANRRRPGSSYVPRRGDPRYVHQNTKVPHPLLESDDESTYSPDAPTVPGGLVDRIRLRAGVRP